MNNLTNYYAYLFNLDVINVEKQREEAKKAGFKKVVDFAFRVDDNIIEVTKDQLINFLNSIQNDKIN